MIEVIATGTEVEFGDDPPIRGMVTAVTVRDGGGRVSYEVVWWDGRSRRCEWLEQCEIRVAEGRARTTEIGFHAVRD